MLKTFTLMVNETKPVEVDIDPQYVETLVDGTCFAKGVPCTQITMISGNKFYVKESLPEVRLKLASI